MMKAVRWIVAVVLLFAVGGAYAQAGVRVYFAHCFVDVPASKKIPKHVLLDAYGKSISQALEVLRAKCKAQLENSAPGECDRAVDSDEYQTCDYGIYLPF